MTWQPRSLYGHVWMTVNGEKSSHEGHIFCDILNSDETCKEFAC